MLGRIGQVRPFIRTDETRNKIAFLSGREREEALLGTIPPHVLPVVYGGEAPLVPLEDAAQQRLSMQRSAAAAKTVGSGASVTAAGGAAGKSSRLASAGRAISRWSGATWALLKKPAQVRTGHFCAAGTCHAGMQVQKQPDHFASRSKSSRGATNARFNHVKQPNGQTIESMLVNIMLGDQTVNTMLIHISQRDVYLGLILARLG